MKIRTTFALGVAGIALMVTLSSCGSDAVSHDKRVFDFRGTLLVVDDPSSDLRIVGQRQPGPDIEAQRWLSGTAAKPGHAFWDLHGETLRLGIACSGLVLRCGSRFQLTVPPNVSVMVHTGSGNDTLLRLTGSVTVQGGSGHVQFADMAGPVSVSTESGNVTASDLRSPVVHVSSDEGRVDIGFVLAPQTVQVTNGSGNATVRIPTVENRYRVSATSDSGSAQSKVPNDRKSRMTVRVASKQGRVEVLPAAH